MSLEQALAENNQLLKQLNENFTRLFAFSANQPLPDSRIDSIPVTTPDKTKKAAKVEAEVAQQNAEAATATAEAAEVPAALRKMVAANEPNQAVPYDDVKNAVLDFVKGGKRGQVVKTLSDYSVDRADQLKPEQYAEFLAALKKACA